MALPFMAKNAALMPLFVAVGLGIGGSVGFGVHYLANSPDVVIRKKTNAEPWNKVMPDQNTKLFSWNQDFWAQQKAAMDPRLGYLQSKPESERTLHEQAIVERAKALNRDHTHHN